MVVTLYFQQNLQAAAAASRLCFQNSVWWCQDLSYLQLYSFGRIGIHSQRIILKMGTFPVDLLVAWPYQLLQQFSNYCRLSCWTLLLADCPNVPLFSKVSKGTWNVCLQFSACSLPVLQRTIVGSWYHQRIIIANVSEKSLSEGVC